jgi:serine/threonine-protein kinase
MGTEEYSKYLLRQDFRYLHEPLRGARSEKWAVGRSEKARTFADRIIFSRGGAFLVTGFRGVGKTTFVHLAIHLIHQQQQRFARVVGDFQLVDVWINLARPLTPQQLMHHFIRHLYLRLRELNLLDEMDPALRRDLRVAYRRTSYQIATKVALAEERSRESELGFENAPLIGLPFKAKLSSSAKTTRSDEEDLSYLPYDDKSAEFDVLDFSVRLAQGYRLHETRWQRLRRRLAGRPAPTRRLKVLFVLDELDKLEKIGGAQGRTSPVETLLEALKTVFTATEFSFVFIAGKDTHERWVEDVSLGDSIYESVFAYDVYLGCLWDEQSQLVDSCFQREAIPQASADGVGLLRLYLQYKGRGMPRRILRELNSFIFWDNDQPFLMLKHTEQRYMGIFAKLQEALDDSPEVFGTRAEALEDTRFDRQRLAVYYTLDWILRRGRETFTVAEALEVASHLNLGWRGDGAAREISAEAIVGLLRKRKFLERVEQTVIKANDGSALLNERYKLAEWVLRAFQGAPESEFAAKEAPPAAGAAAPKTEFEFLGRYRVLEKIGQGGFATVYRVADPAGAVRAAKVLHRDLAASEDAVQRFRREIEIQAQLKHPSIVQFFEIGTVEGVPYFVMEFLAGHSLKHILANLRRLPEATAATITHDLAEVYAYVHTRGFVRNDIKPSNVMFTGDGRLKVIDFGIARSNREQDSKITMAGEMIGTPSYMSPEQAYGRTVDGRSDVFSLGVVLYEMLTGETPFQGETLMDQLRRLFEGNFTPPSRFASVSPQLEAVVTKALAHDPAGRFSSMEEFAAALQSVAPPVDLQELVRETQTAEKVLSQSLEEDTVIKRRQDFEPKPEEAEPVASPVLSPPDEGQRCVEMLHSSTPGERRAAMDKLRELNPPDLYDLMFDFPEGSCLFTAKGVSATPLVKQHLTLGRVAHCELQLDRPEISRQHAAFSIGEATVEVEDLGSANGLRLNGNRSSRAELHDGDRIEIGPVVIRVHIILPAAVPAAG